jgi:hypothetical protein
MNEILLFLNFLKYLVGKVQITSWFKRRWINRKRSYNSAVARKSGYVSSRSVPRFSNQMEKTHLISELKRCLIIFSAFENVLRVTKLK